MYLLPVLLPTYTSAISCGPPFFHPPPPDDCAPKPHEIHTKWALRIILQLTTQVLLASMLTDLPFANSGCNIVHWIYCLFPFFFSFETDHES
ncbi:hypothetical protein GGS24DRAFT_460564 [Hypoxylon argillaceum]|nr:hypothetical protein GGS24DRAFT_460564 [Hypoxylon argillaceum]